MNNKPDPLEEFWKELEEWSNRTFGPTSHRGPLGPLKHLRKEINEAIDSPYNLEEYADLLFLVFDSCRRAGFSYETLVSVVNYKLTKNKNRIWPDWTLSNPNEPIEHIRGCKNCGGEHSTSVCGTGIQ